MSKRAYTKQQFVRSLIATLIIVGVVIGIVAVKKATINKEVKESVEKSSQYFSNKIVKDLDTKFGSKKKVLFALMKSKMLPKNLDIVKKTENSLKNKKLKLQDKKSEVKRIETKIAIIQNELSKSKIEDRDKAEKDIASLENNLEKVKKEVEELPEEISATEGELQKAKEERKEMLGHFGMNKADADKITSLSIESVAIWEKKDDGKLYSVMHTLGKLNRKDIYGFKKNEELNEDNVKQYFRLKLENDWLSYAYSETKDFNMENLDEVFSNNNRERFHAVKKFEMKGKEYLLDLQFSKQSVFNNRITKAVQRNVIVMIVIMMIALTIYALIFDINMLMHVLVAYVLIFTIYPLTWMVSLTFNKTSKLGGTTLNPIPKDGTLDNYKAAFLNLKRMRIEGIVLEDGRLFIGEEVIKEGSKPLVEGKHIKSVFNVFDPENNNYSESKDIEFVVEEDTEKVMFEGEEKTLKKNLYYIEMKNKPDLPQNMQVYNVEYYTHINQLFISGILNSLFISITTAFVGMVLSSAAAYAFSRFKFPGRDGFMMSFLITQMFPSIMMLIPLYIIFSNMGFINTFRGLILASSIGALPFNIWNLKGFFDTVPKDLEEAAVIDGCSASQTFFRIVLPLSTPALAISALFSFMGAWNEYIMAATFLTREDKYTIPVIIKMLVGSYSVDYPMFATMSVLVSIPVVTIFIMAQKYLVGGLTAGGVKG